MRGVDEVAVCTVCEDPLESPGGSDLEPGTDGSLAWRRGERVELERVRQCDACAAALAATMFRRFEDEDDGG